MAKIYVSAVIPALAADVWRLVRDFNALPQWTDFVAESRIEGGRRPDEVGCIRNFRLKDGGTIRERLLSLSDYDMSCSYEILDSPMAVENYLASLSLTPVTETGATFAQWQAEFDCAAANEAALTHQIGQGVFASAFASLSRRMAG